jgi:hypothetical protein
MSLISKTNIDHIGQTLLDHPRIRPALHDRTGSPQVQAADANHRMMDMCHELVDCFGLTNDSGALKISIIPTADFDRMAFTYELMTDPDRLERGTKQWHAERKILSSNRNQLRRKLNGRARRLFPAFQITVAEHGRTLRIVPIDQLALEIPSRGMHKIASQMVGHHQELMDMLSRDDIKGIPFAETNLVMAKQSLEVLYSYVDVTLQHAARNLDKLRKELNLGQMRLL